MDLIAVAVPFFLLLIAVEFSYGLLRGRNTYRVNDTVNSLSMGTLSSINGLVIVGFSALIYEYIVDTLQLTQLPADSALVWVMTFVLYDLAYYWKHRLGHEVALFWGSHVSHHQSEDYNLSTALRQTSIDFHGFLFLIPFFLIGVPGEIIVTSVSLNLIYQFWVHTQHVPKLSFIEWIMVTPSNHRVHHARNDRYVDKNYGGVFIVWDRIFGTFQDELDDEPAVYGLRKPLNSWNPLWANIHVYWRLLVDFVTLKGIGNKFKLLIKPPGWLPENQLSSCKAKRTVDLTSKYDPPLHPLTRIYVASQFIATLSVSLPLAGLAENATQIELWAAVLFVAGSLFVHGYILDRRKHTLLWECGRLIAGIMLALLVPLGDQLSTILLTSSCVALLLVFGSVLFGHNLLTLKPKGSEELIRNAENQISITR